MLALSGAMLSGYGQPSPAIYKAWDKGFTEFLHDTHDMALPAWGPYSDRFNGISHVPAKNDGLRFDVVVQPSFYLRNGVKLGNTQRESGYHPWQATPDLSYFSYRYELEWKDRVYCDVSFSKVDEQSRLIRAEFVNNTHNNRSLALNLFSSLMYPYARRIKAVLPAQAEWIPAATYQSLTDSVRSFNYNLVYNGQLRGQITDDRAVSHTAIATSKNAGQTLSYRFNNDRDLRNAVLLIRYRTDGGRDARLRYMVKGRTSRVLSLKGNREYTTVTIDLDDAVKSIDLALRTIGDPTVIIDGFALLDNKELSALRFDNEEIKIKPQQLALGLPNAAIFKYDDVQEYYGLIWDDRTADRRVIQDSNPDEALSKFDNLVRSGGARLNSGHIIGNDKGWFENVFSAPIVVRPGQRTSRYALVVSGKTEAEVSAKLRQFNGQWAKAPIIADQARTKATMGQVNNAGKSFEFSQQLMAATTLTNLNYPVFAGNRYFKHTTPGKRWSSFYTWDSGFIGLGQTELNLGRALESLNAYTMSESEQSAFLEHGTPLPTQAYLFNELWARTQNIEYLRYFYPRLKRYYGYLNGAEGSPTRRLRSGLIQTWDIFYNSGGWDDYSPQVYTHQQKLEAVVAPAVNTAHQIRFAKMLRSAAWQLGLEADMKQYDADIATYSNALQRYAWDEASGYYGYVKHDAEGNAQQILKHSTGANFNMGLDGCSPLIAGVCTPEQQQKIMGHLFNKKKLWTDNGITTIDQSAPYYNPLGYWNGRVWMPHQWFFWKTMFDLDRPEKAVQIAQTALNVWKRETDDTYNCWENFDAATGTGGGWHQFGALSSPVLNWFAALYKPGNITYGFNLWCTEQTFSDQKDAFKGKFKLFSDPYARNAAMLICLNDHYQYKATCNGKPIAMKKVVNGTYIIHLTSNQSSTYAITVKRADH